MKKLILFLLTISAFGQNPTNFPYGIKNTAAATNGTPTYIVTSEVDGVHKKTPASLFAKTAEVIHNNGTAETKIGGLTIGKDLKITNDKWIAFGTSVTDLDKYTVPAAKMMNVDVLNYGVSGSNSSTLAGLYSNIPTYTPEYRLLTIEHTINDCQTYVSLPTFRANILGAINNARSKGFPNDRMALINGNECSNVLPNNANFQLYADEVINLAKSEGLQYFDAYNYTKNNGSTSLTDDGIHPNDFGGEIYARGLIASLQGGMEIGGGLTVDNSIKTFGSLEAKKDIATLGSIKTGNDPQNNPTHNIVGDIYIPTNAGIGSQFVNSNYQTRITPLEIIGGSYLATTFRNYTNFGGFEWYTANGVAGAQNNSLSLRHDGMLTSRTGITTPALYFSNPAYTNYLFKTDGSIYDIANIFPSSGGTINGNVTIDGKFKYKYSNSIASTDLNNLKEAGFYNGYSLSNAPNGNSGFFWITVENHDSSDTWTHQTATSYGSSNTTNEIYTRTQQDGTWTAWKRILDADSPTLTGTPTAPTAAAGTNTTQIATTAFVQAKTTDWTKTGNDIRNNNSGEIELKPLTKVSILNSSNVEKASIDNVGRVSGSSFQDVFWNSGMSFFDGGQFLNFHTNNGNTNYPVFSFTPDYSSFNTGAGVGFIGMYQGYTIAPTSGSVPHTMLQLTPTINQTGGANGITRAIYINPTLTSAADFRAIEVTAGKVVVPNITATAVQEYADNAAAVTAGLSVGTFYRTGDLLKVVH